MFYVIVAFIFGSYIPTASVPLKGIGMGCFPFYLEEQTTFLTYPAAIDNINIPDYIGIGKYSISADPSHVRLAIRKPRVSMMTFDLRSYGRSGSDYLDLQFKHAIGIKNFGLMYGVEYYHRTIQDTTYDWRQRLNIMKINFEGVKNLLLNLGIMSGKFWFTEYGVEYTPGWLIGPIVELRYDLTPFSLYLNSRHPESLREVFLLPLYSQGYPGYDYNLFPFEAGFGFANKIEATKLLVLGVRTRYAYEIFTSDTMTVDMTTLGIAFVCGCEIEVTKYLRLRGGFEIDYTGNISDTTITTMEYAHTMGASIDFGDNFELHITTKNLAMPLNSEAIIRWYF